MPADGKHCLLDLSSVSFIDSTGIGYLIHLQKRVRAGGALLVLLSPHKSIVRALKLMRLDGFFCIADGVVAARELLAARETELSSAVGLPAPGASSPLTWRGEIIAANVEEVWRHTSRLLADPELHRAVLIDMSQVRFIDSSGLGLMVRVKKFAQRRQIKSFFVGLKPSVRSVLQLARLEEFLMDATEPDQPRRQARSSLPRPPRTPENNSLSHLPSANKLP